MRILFCECPPLGGEGGVANALLAEDLATRHGPGLAVPGRGASRCRPIQPSGTRLRRLA